MTLRKITDQAIEHSFLKKYIVYYIIYAYKGQEGYLAKYDQWCQHRFLCMFLCIFQNYHNDAA